MRHQWRISKCVVKGARDFNGAAFRRSLHCVAMTWKAYKNMQAFPPCAQRHQGHLAASAAVTTGPCGWDGCCGAPLWRSPSGLFAQATFLIAVTPIMHAFWNLKEGSQEHLIDMCAALVICSPAACACAEMRRHHVTLTP